MHNNHTVSFDNSALDKSHHNHTISFDNSALDKSHNNHKVSFDNSALDKSHNNFYLKNWGAWDTTCGHKAKDITPMIAWRREVWKEEALDDLPWKDERGPSSSRRTLEPFQRQSWGNFWETGWSAYGLFRAHRYHPDLNWSLQTGMFARFQAH